MSDTTIRIVVGVDFTETGDRALDEAIRYLMRIDDDELHAVHVTNVPRNVAKADRTLDEAAAHLREKVVERCEAVGQRWEQKIFFHVRIGDAAKELHQVAVDVDADLLVVGTRARRGLGRILGSVANELVTHAHVPVLVAHPKELEGLERSPEPEPPRPGEDLHRERIMSDEHLVFGKRPSHISGLV